MISIESGKCISDAAAFVGSVSFSFDEIIFRTQSVDRADRRTDNGAVKLLENRDDAMPDLISGVVIGEIRAVGDIGKVILAEPVLDLTSADRKYRADNISPHRRNSGDSL